MDDKSSNSAYPPPLPLPPSLPGDDADDASSAERRPSKNKITAIARKLLSAKPSAASAERSRPSKERVAAIARNFADRAENPVSDAARGQVQETRGRLPASSCEAPAFEVPSHKASWEDTAEARLKEDDTDHHQRERDEELLSSRGDLGSSGVPCASTNEGIDPDTQIVSLLDADGMRHVDSDAGLKQESRAGLTPPSSNKPPPLPHSKSNMDDPVEDDTDHHRGSNDQLPVSMREPGSSGLHFPSSKGSLQSDMLTTPLLASLSPDDTDAVAAPIAKGAYAGGIARAARTWPIVLSLLTLFFIGQYLLWGPNQLDKSEVRKAVPPAEINQHQRGTNETIQRTTASKVVKDKSAASSVGEQKPEGEEKEARKRAAAAAAAEKTAAKQVAARNAAAQQAAARKAAAEKAAARQAAAEKASAEKAEAKKTAERAAAEKKTVAEQAAARKAAAEKVAVARAAANKAAAERVASEKAAEEKAEAQRVAEKVAAAKAAAAEQAAARKAAAEKAAVARAAAENAADKKAEAKRAAENVAAENKAAAEQAVARKAAAEKAAAARAAADKAAAARAAAEEAAAERINAKKAAESRATAARAAAQKIAAARAAAARAAAEKARQDASVPKTLPCSHPTCGKGRCDQRGCWHSTCEGGHCNQEGAFEPSCSAGGCKQAHAVRPTCGGGHCDQTGSSGASCSGTDCLV
eukprot:TRINITY_DN2835_c7_g1_i2.p1 TRINITY_DN2835_c7_g1~~TRINITY_DN2835_c7_g1_i2.p1  ORF type:complete len:798 (-),score=226.15 TRINITY_DN2835_c7_g1_i2:41-2131(-)